VRRGVAPWGTNSPPSGGLEPLRRRTVGGPIPQVLVTPAAKRGRKPARAGRPLVYLRLLPTIRNAKKRLKPAWIKALQRFYIKNFLRFFLKTGAFCELGKSLPQNPLFVGAYPPNGGGWEITSEASRNANALHTVIQLHYARKPRPDSFYAVCNAFALRPVTTL
jgi:hypothetical protein